MSKSKTTELKKKFKSYFAAQKNEAKENHVHDIWEFMHLITVNAKFSKDKMGQTELFNDLRDNSPEQQETLLRIITAFLEDKNLEKIKLEGKGQVWYLFANAVASYSSYNRYYWISKGAMEVLEDNEINTSSPVTRSKIFQIRDADRKKILTFEHMCPATQLIEFLLSEKQKDKKVTLKRVKTIMEDYGLVAIITKKEDKKLSGTWKSTVNVETIKTPLKRMLNRYDNDEFTIKLEEKLIPVYGKMYR
jgi:chromosome segregation and condensation protein ScpB